MTPQTEARGKICATIVRPDLNSGDCCECGDVIEYQIEITRLSPYGRETHRTCRKCRDSVLAETRSGK